jgi:hypothetical protein
MSLADLAAANAEFQKLALHIEANKVYYTNRVWLAEDPDARLERLRIQGIAKYVRNELVGFVGSRAIYPLRLDSLPASTRTQLRTQILAVEPFTDDQDGKAVGVQESDVSLPTKGLVMEVVPGRCEALEPYLQSVRELDLAKAKAEVDRLTAGGPA